MAIIKEDKKIAIVGIFTLFSGGKIYDKITLRNIALRRVRHRLIQAHKFHEHKFEFTKLEMPPKIDKIARVNIAASYIHRGDCELQHTGGGPLLYTLGVEGEE